MKITCRGNIIDLSSPKIMGILNITPDSFFDGGKYKSDKEIIKQTRKMLKQGATFIDIGAYSSRPNAKHISEEEELNRILPVVKLLVNKFPNILISIDTFRSQVAKECLNAGACMINDISGGNFDKNMFTIIAKYQVPYILMHILGTPQNMQDKPEYKDVIHEIKDFFTLKTNQLKKLKVKDVILDVGFGFGKTIEHNYTILKQLNSFTTLNYPILVGISRKSMLYKVLNSTPKKMKNATSIANTIAILNGANILRVHDVKEAMQCIKIIKALG
ncbi:MAG TPA: dihydropteroate synthase [Flavobacteriaceae bacterium]|nr:dihydropteroate synthase [Flavobacteriaceae bacterium]HIP27073.1 dihydropteroate synthase [Flavobacteriaceae bacterium]